jgi:hypothetical protein
MSPLDGDADHRHGVEQCLADAGQGVGHAGARHNADDARPAGGPRITIGRARRREFMRHQQILQPLRLHGVPEFVLLGAGDAEDEVGPFFLQRFNDRLRAGHMTADPTLFLASAAEVRPGDDLPGGQRGQSGSAGGAKQAAAGDRDVHVRSGDLHPMWRYR